MAAPSQSLRGFQPTPPTPSQILTAQFNAFLKPGIISLRSHTTINNAQTVIDIIRKRINAHIPPVGSDKQRLQHYIDTAYTVIYGSSVKDIAIDHAIAPDSVRRIINVVGVAVQICLGHCDAVYGRGMNIWSILDPSLPPITAVDTTTPWPTGATQHALALQKALDTLPRVFLKPGLVAVPISHLEHVRNGTALLGQSLANLYRQFQDRAQARAHAKQVAESSSSGRSRVSPSTLPAPQSARGPSAELEHEVSSFQNIAVAGSNHSSQHINAQQKLPADSMDPSARSRNPSAELPLRRSPPTSFNPDRTKTAKRAMSQPRGTSPVKKKIKEDPSQFEAYQLFALAERSRLEAEFPTIHGSDLSELLSTIWGDMRPEERCHFEDIYLKLQRHEEQGIATDVAKKIEVVRAIPRCQTVVDAKDTYVSPKQSRRHRLQTDHAPTRSQPPLDRSRMRQLKAAVSSHTENNNASKTVEETEAQKVTKFDDDDDSWNAPVTSFKAMSDSARWYENYAAFDKEKAQKDDVLKKNSESVLDKDGDQNMDDEML